MLCIRCQKRPAIIFIQRMDGGQMKQEATACTAHGNCTSSRWMI